MQHPKGLHGRTRRGLREFFDWHVDSSNLENTSHRQAAYQQKFSGTMTDCLNKKTITYSKRAVQRSADAHVEPPTAVSSSSLGGFPRYASEATSKSKTGTLHAYLHRLPPSVGVKRKSVRKLFNRSDLFHLYTVLMNASARHQHL
jgi:hypothetical protein